LIAAESVAIVTYVTNLCLCTYCMHSP